MAEEFIDPETGRKIKEPDILGPYTVAPTPPRPNYYAIANKGIGEALKNFPDLIGKAVRGIFTTPATSTSEMPESKKTGNGPIFNIYAEKTGQEPSTVIAPATPTPQGKNWYTEFGGPETVSSRYGIPSITTVGPELNRMMDIWGGQTNFPALPKEPLPSLPTQYFMKNPEFVQGGEAPYLIPAIQNRLTNQFEPTYTTRPQDTRFETMRDYGIRTAIPSAGPPVPPTEVYKTDERGNLIPIKRYTGQYGTTWQTPTAGTFPTGPETAPFYSVGPQGALPIRSIEEYNRILPTTPVEPYTVEGVNLRGAGAIGGREEMKWNPQSGRMEPVAPPITVTNPVEAAKLENAKAIQLLHNQGELDKVKALRGNAESLAILQAELGKTGKTLTDYYFQLYSQSEKAYNEGAINQSKPIEQRTKELEAIANLNWKIAQSVWQNSKRPALPIGQTSAEATRILSEAETLPQWKQMTEEQRETFRRMVRQKYQ